jgi:hypothetical protein
VAKVAALRRPAIQPDDRKQRKTDRRDAAALSELLWVNRDRLVQGKPVRRLRQVDIARSTDQENRRRTRCARRPAQAWPVTASFGPPRRE